MEVIEATSFALVIPTLNEEGSIGAVLQRVVEVLGRTHCGWEILVVDDSSIDSTAKVVEQFAQADPRVRLLVRKKERGLAGAIIHGWSHTTADLLGVIDADLQHPPEAVVALLEQVMKGADLAIASRYIRPGSMDGWNPVRKLLSRVSVLASIPVQKDEIKVRDPLSGFFLVRRRCIEGLHFQKTGFKLLLEILAKGKIRSVVEVPFRFGFRESGVSKASAMTGIHYISLLLRLSFLRSSRQEQQN
jgi:dolichol-phosphate mannosyltransferase